MKNESDNNLNLLNSKSDTKNGKRRGKLFVMCDLILTQIYPNYSNDRAFRSICLAPI